MRTSWKANNAYRIGKPQNIHSLEWSRRSSGNKYNYYYSIKGNQNRCSNIELILNILNASFLLFQARCCLKNFNIIVSFRDGKSSSYTWKSWFTSNVITQHTKNFFKNCFKKKSCHKRRAKTHLLCKLKHFLTSHEQLATLSIRKIKVLRSGYVVFKPWIYCIHLALIHYSWQK